jgi:hypothetical protein
VGDLVGAVAINRISYLGVAFHNSRYWSIIHWVISYQSCVRYSFIFYIQIFAKDIVISPRKWKMLLFAYHAGEVKALAVAHLYWLAIASEACSLKPLSMKQKDVLTVLKLTLWTRKPSAKQKTSCNISKELFSVPHSGADAATLLSYFKFIGLSKIIGNLTPFSRRMAKMSVMMQDTVYNKGIIIYAFAEGKPTHSNEVCTISQL